MEENYAPDFYRKLADRGWIGLNWPREYGGQGRSWIETTIFHEEIGHSGAPIGPALYCTTVGLFGNILLRYGSERQKHEYLPRITAGEMRVARGFTEPGAGHDLAAVETRAVADGDDYIIDGQKCFISSANVADHIFLMARTSPDRPKDEGITLFIIDINAPGITVRPLWTMAGFRTNEVFLDGVRVNKRDVIGEENRGWQHLNEDPFFRYVMIIGEPLGELRRVFDVLVWYAKELSGRQPSPGSDPLVRQRLAGLATEIEVLRLITYYAAYLRDKGLTGGCQPYMVKMFEGELWQRLSDFGMDLLGLLGPLGGASKHAFLYGMMEVLSRSSVLMLLPGSSEILRNAIAIEGLGLPRQL